MTTRVSFRNVDADVDDPVDTWPYEALVTALERGTIGDWVRVTRAVDADPWGVVAREVEDYLATERPAGLAPLLERAVARARRQRVEEERAQVAAEVTLLVGELGLGMAGAARRLGTSRSRLSTYRSGAVTPSAAFMVRLRRLAGSGVGPEGPRTSRPGDPAGSTGS